VQWESARLCYSSLFFASSLPQCILPFASLRIPLQVFLPPRLSPSPLLSGYFYSNVYYPVHNSANICISSFLSASRPTQCSLPCANCAILSSASCLNSYLPILCVPPAHCIPSCAKLRRPLQVLLPLPSIPLSL
jgi:hypothetical protein